MTDRSAWPTPGESLLNDSGGGPWGGGAGGSGGSGGGSGGNGSGGGGKRGGGDDGDGGGLGPRNPWSQPPRKRPGPRGQGPSALDELLKRGRGRFGGGGGGMPSLGGRPIWVWGAAALVALWILATSIHQIGPQERGVVTVLGSYSRTLRPGIGMTLPAPLSSVTVLDVDDIRTIDVGSTAASQQNLMLTGDQNIIDLAYSVRWSIRDPELYQFELADPDDTIREVAESAMRAEISAVTLNDAIGPQRSQIEARVQQRAQEILDGYRAGVTVQGVAIKQADPPAQVNDAFKSVSAAQQTAQTFINQARAYAQQLSAKAQGEAAAFDKVYEQYRLAPEVTRRRMYYETMEEVLARTDKTIVETDGIAPLLPLDRTRPAQPAPQAGARP